MLGYEHIVFQVVWTSLDSIGAQQINQEDWRRRIWQLQRELSQERIQPHKPQEAPQELASPSGVATNL